MAPITIRTFFLFGFLFVLGMVAVSCGSDDDDTTVVVNEERPQQEEEGPVETGPTVVVNNRIENNVKVIIRRTRIENNHYHLRWDCHDVDPVIHRQYIYFNLDVNIQCPTLITNDLNRDGVLDHSEIQEAMGQEVLALDTDIESREEEQFPTGSSYTYEQRIPLSDLRSVIPSHRDFAVVIYGVDPTRRLPDTVSTPSDDPIHLTVPIACKVFKSPRGRDGGTTGGADGGTTGGADGGTTGGADGGTTGGADGGT